ncbi:unnamed protein product [Mycena citricolor]|uniref:Ricin B lectin domain-containing protein n=1 Tax=Mycena citricolor TaxID=2018698 RepID=A0AAD2HYC3_9AGAR|nr:unnamed protein product [Mycena citricolor]
MNSSRTATKVEHAESRTSLFPSPPLPLPFSRAFFRPIFLCQPEHLQSFLPTPLNILMLLSTLFSTLLAAGAVSAAPLAARDVSLNAAAVAQSQVRDTTATRALSATTITTSDGRCLSVDPFSGDFRENLTPISAVKCDGSANQTWDVITSGVHNNVKGQALIVSALTQACLNFDNRRQPGNQVLLFSCGGRADGSGQVQSAQLYAFNGATGPQALVPQSSNGKTCLTINSANHLDQVDCNGASSATGLELFTFGGSGAAAAAATTAAAAAATTAAALATTSDAAAATCAGGKTTVTVTVTVTQSAAAVSTAAVITAAATTAAPTNVAVVQTTAAATAASGPIAVSGAGGVLNPTAVAESHPRDTTAVRAASGVPIKDSAGKCLTVNPQAGDFRENLIPIQLAACDGSAGQQWDFITQGIHNNQANSALIVSTLTNGCLNFDDRRAPGDQVIIFSCGGRADGSGKVTNSQLFPFTSSSLSAPYVLAPENGNNKVCFVDNNGRLGNTACDATKAAANQLFTIGSGAAAAAAGTTVAAATTAAAAVTTTAAAVTSIAAAAVTTAAPATTTVAATATGPISVSRAGLALNPTAVAESQARDNTATRAATGVQIKDSTGKCLAVNPLAGDFRENLIPVDVVACDGSAGQKWDFITKGVHNDQANSALIVSSLTQGCLNFDDRRAAGDQVLLFSCGGRADGAGKVTNSQLFPFTSTSLSAPYALAPENGNNQVCFVNNNGVLDNVSCNAASASGNQLFTIVP